MVKYGKAFPTSAELFGVWILINPVRVVAIWTLLPRNAGNNLYLVCEIPGSKSTTNSVPDPRWLKTTIPMVANKLESSHHQYLKSNT
jgi:hypothetical protein